jgi:hypothetical protein
MDAAKDIHKVMLPIWAAFICGRYTGYTYKQRAYDHIPIQTYEEACS